MARQQRRQIPAFTLLRFHQRPTNLTAVSQVSSAQQALALLAHWLRAHPRDEALIFDLADRPVTRETLHAIVAREEHNERAAEAPWRL
jgi:CTP:molybdopterin cytidylyltransferase MocA